MTKMAFRMTKMVFIFCVSLLVHPAPFGWAQPTVPVFGEAMQITDTDRESLLARSPKGSFQFDKQGNLHLVYTEKNGEGTGLGNPGMMLYRVYQNGEWNEARQIRTEAGEGIPYQSGGEPVLYVEDDQTVHFAWHDYRHSTSASGLDRVEVYYRRLSPEGIFETEEIRISDHDGNSWRPKMDLTPSGRIAIAWYDFMASSFADVLVALSDAEQFFTGAADFEGQVIQGVSENASGGLLPQIAFDSQGRMHVIWTVADMQGFYYMNERLYYGMVEEIHTKFLTQRQQISAKGTTSMDPAKIQIDTNDTVWVAWTDLANDIPNIHVAFKTANAATFGEAIPLTENTLPDNVELAAMALGPHGLVHVAWTDYRTGEGDIYLRVYDPQTESLSDSLRLTTDDFTVDQRPGLAISPAGQVAVVWESTIDGRTNLMMRLSENATSVDEWEWVH